MTTITTEVGTVDQSVTGYTTTPVRGTASFNSDVQTRMDEMDDNATEINTVRTQINAVAGNINDVATEMNTVASEVNQSASNAASSASSAEDDAAIAASYANAIIATSTTSVTIGTGSKTFTVQTGKQFAAGQFVSIISDADSDNYMHGAVTSYSGTTLIVNVTNTGGSGTFADWGISLSGSQGAKGDTGGSEYRTLLYSVTATAASAVVFEDDIDGTYDKYIIESDNFHTSLNSNPVGLTVGTGTGPTYQSSNYRTTLAKQASNSTTLTITNDESDSRLLLGLVGGTGTGARISISIGEPASSYRSFIQSQLSVSNSASSTTVSGYNGVAKWDSTTPITALKIEPDSGTISGTFKLYGVK